MRIVLVSDVYGRSTGFPAWSLEVQFSGPLRPGYEREHRYCSVWGLGLMAIWKSNAVGPAKPARPRDPRPDDLQGAPSERSS